MREIPLAMVARTGSLDYHALLRHLADLPLPPRTAALLDTRGPDAGTEAVVRAEPLGSRIRVRPELVQGRTLAPAQNSRPLGPDPLNGGPARGLAPAADRATDGLRTALTALVRHLGSGDADRDFYQGAVASLVGLGPGLTPTGDDLLVALVAAGRAFASGGAARNGNGRAALMPRAGYDALVSAVAQVPAGMTTKVAEHLLSESVAGRFPEPLGRLVRALGDPDVDRATLDGLVEQLAATGAHSGADWLAGVVALARACVGEPW